LRILVLSDSHGDYWTMEKAIKAQPTAEIIVFLGDGYADFEKCKHLFGDREIYAVTGNNDFHCQYPRNEVIEANGVKIYATHGHLEYVKSHSAGLLSAMRRNDCKIGLYGHTHVQKSDYVNGLYLFNPGSLRDKNQYGVIDITEQGIICIGMQVK